MFVADDFASGDLVPYLGRYLIPPHYTVELEDDRFASMVDVLVEDGAPRCVGIRRRRDVPNPHELRKPHVRPALTGELLRRLPLHRVLQVTATAIAFEQGRHKVSDIDPLDVLGLKPDEDGKVELRTPVRWGGRDAMGAVMKAHEQAVRAPRRGSRIADAQLRTVASVYREALRTGAPPAEAVKDELGVPRSTAGRWVAEARRRGFLPATTRGRAAA